MNSIKTSLCAAARIAVKPVQFQLAIHDERPYWFATQTLEVTLHDGNECSVVIHLEEGCCTLLAGEPVVMPPVPALQGEPA